MRVLTLFLGHTTLSVTAVLTSFMFGLALGSFFGGQISRKIPKAKLLPAFCCIELAIALSAGLIHPLMKLALPHLSSSSHGFFISFLFLCVPTTLMGMTFPLLSEWLSQKGPSSEGRLGWLYGFNTAGAVSGALLAGFYLLPSIGINKSFLTAGIFNFISAALAYAVFYRHKEMASSVSSARNEGSFVTLLKPYFPVLFLTGMGSLVCEIAWTRSFAMVIGSSTYSFTVMLGTYLIGLALGGLLFGYLKEAIDLPSSWLPPLLLFTAASILIYLPYFNHLPYLFVRLFPLSVQSPFLLHLTQFLLCSSFMLGPVLLMGFSFPWLLTEADQRSQGNGFSIGLLYAVNTIGCIAGALLGGIVLLPWIGSEKALVFSAWTFVAAAGLVFFITKPFTIKMKALNGIILAVIVAVSFFRSPWNPYILSSGAFLYAPQYVGLSGYRAFIEDVEQNTMLFYRDGITSNVAVLSMQSGGRFLRINGKTDASSVNDMKTQLMLSYLPLLFHAGPAEEALVIGLGSGVSLGGLTTDSHLKKIVCVELEPAVKQAQGFFIDINRNAIEDQRVEVVLNDARYYLSTASQRFDIISSEPSNPWMAGVANLYTKEAFELVKNRLKPGGIFCQWFHSYAMGQEDFKMVIKTFTEVFPHSMLMTTGNEDFFLMGSVEPWRFQYKEMESKFIENTQMSNDLTRVGLGHPFSLMAASFLLDDSDMRNYSKTAVVHRDDRPILEFSAPRFLHRGEGMDISRNLLAAKTKMVPDGFLSDKPDNKKMALLYNLAGEAFMRTGQANQASDAFEKAFKLNPSNPRTLTNKGRIFNAMDQHFQAEEIFKKAISLDHQYALARFHLGMVYLEQGFESKGLRLLEEGLRLAPGDPMGSLQVAQIYSQMGKNKEAEALLFKALHKPIADPDLMFRLIQMHQALKLENNKKPPPA